MRRHAAGAADEGLGHDRGHDNGRILLRHPDGVAGDIFVDDEIADDQHPHARHFGERRFELRELEAVADRKIERLDDRGEIRIRIIPLHQRQRGKAQFARAEHQPAAIAVDHRLLGVVAVLEFLALDHHVRLQRGDEGIGGNVQGDRVVDHADRAHILQPHLLRHRDARRVIGIDADDEQIGLLGGEFQQPEVSGMDDIEIAGDEGDAVGRAAGNAQRMAVGGTKLGPVVQFLRLQTSSARHGFTWRPSVRFESEDSNQGDTDMLNNS